MGETTADQLTATLRKLRQRISETRSRNLSINEQTTKAALINPLLAALGWDIEDLDEVSFEYRRKPQDNPVDYALFLLRSPCLFVEAKSFDNDLSNQKWINQMLGYATVVGVEWCVLTNGDDYRLYNAFAPVDSDGKLFRTIRVSDANQHQATVDTLSLLSKERMSEKQLSVLWNAYFVDRRVKSALTDLFNRQDPDQALVNILRRKLEGLSTKDIRNSLKRAEVHVEFPIVAQQPEPGDKSGKPAASTLAKDAGRKDRKPPEQVPATLRDLIDAGLIAPPLELETTYLGATLTAIVNSDASVVFQNQSFESLSVAAGMARKSVKGQPPDGRAYWQTNGWTFWKYRDRATGEWVEIDRLRREFVARHHPM